MFSFDDPDARRQQLRQEDVRRKLDQTREEQLLAERRSRGEWDGAEWRRNTILSLAVPGCVLVILLLFILTARQTVELLQTIGVLPTSANATLNVTLDANESSALVFPGL